MIKEYGVRSDIPEDVLQAKCYQWIHNLPERPLVFHVANERKTSMRHGSKLKALGVRSGIPDLIVVWPGMQPIAIELKTKANKLTEEQRTVLGYLYANDWHVAVCVSLEGVQEFFNTLNINR
jgi:hypothetical protein